MSNAIVTLLYDTSYLAGALVLGLSLRQILAARPQFQASTELAVLIDATKFTPAQLDLLRSVYHQLIEVDPLESSLVHKLTHDLNRPELHKTFTKILLWKLPYQKVLYLDADTLPAVPFSADKGTVLDLFGLDFPTNKVVAAPDSGFPDVFNSGVMLLQPNSYDYNALENLVEESATNDDVSFDGADQGLLNQYFNSTPDWVRLVGATGGNINLAASFNNWIKLPFLYNVTPSAQYQYLPAFQHFGGTAKSETPDQPIASDSESAPVDVLQSTTDTLGRYGAAALSYINRSQIKLIHFIGPVKPWHVSSSLHEEWWGIWHGQFGDRTIEDVINSNVVHHNEVAYAAPVEEPIEQPHEPTPEESHHEVVETHHEHESSGFNPSTLLDPANYAEFESVEPSGDALWDPAREAPPTAGPVHENNHVLDDIKRFSNIWDSEEPKEIEVVEPEQHHEEHTQEQHQNHEVHHEEHSQDHHEDHQEPPQYHEEVQSGVHLYEYVRPERVFDVNQDYFPKHKLQERAEELSTAVEVDPVDVPTTPTLSVLNNVADKLQNLDVASDTEYEPHDIDDDEEEEPELQEEEYHTDVPKLFPWEFRRSAGPERVWD